MSFLTKFVLKIFVGKVCFLIYYFTQIGDVYQPQNHFNIIKKSNKIETNYFTFKLKGFLFQLLTNDVQVFEHFDFSFFFRHFDFSVNFSKFDLLIPPPPFQSFLSNSISPQEFSKMPKLHLLHNKTERKKNILLTVKVI